MFFLFLESLGTTELLVILVVALLLFGPRKLPEMTRKFGKSLNDFKRVGDDFKQTWEREVALENLERESAIDRAMVAETPAGETHEVAAGESIPAASQPARDITEAAYAPVQGVNVARGAGVETPVPATTDAAVETGATAEQQPSRKSDWL
ncbi:MAG: twin-arginine translocase TatA/TatE family subunit [Acidobacteria bacterium]|nr:twin-arginine translocase TatA/TatE family subunit [Acidobacteriota bacterium]